MKVCPDCGKQIDNRSTRCNRCTRLAEAKPTRQRFWEKVDKNGPIMPPMTTPCWVWTAGFFRIIAHGKHYFYGNLTLPGHKSVYAHRFSWEIAHNQPIPKGIHILHKCDNPPCVNPDHLFIGTPSDNMRDMATKGRTGVKYGEKNWNSKLTRELVEEIRKRYSSTRISQRQLAKEYGVTQTAIFYILKGKNWKQS